jgi:hypothetical protein
MNSLSDRDVGAVPGGTDKELILGWVSSPCDRQVALLIRADALAVQFAPRRACDALAIVHAVTLRFDRAVAPAAFEVTAVPATILPEPELVTPVAPPPTAEG